MEVRGKNYRAVWMEGNKLFMIDQELLPFRFKILSSESYRDTAKAIIQMKIRGAGTIGAAAGYAMAQAFLECSKRRKILWEKVDKAKEDILSTRPTAYDLYYAVNRVYNKAKLSKHPQETALTEAAKIAQEYVEAAKMIGYYGEKLLKQDCKVATHCNAGWLALVDWGSALAPIYFAHRKGKNIFVWVSETRPRNQGSKLTAWELHNEGINYCVITDSAFAYFASKGEIDLVIVGADRITMNGDVINKIGTLDKAIIAEKYKIPFYVAAPISTFDYSCLDSAKVPIEERSASEILYQKGLAKNNKLESVLTCLSSSPVRNPAFDIVPSNLIKLIITNKGLIRPNKRDIMKLFK